MNHKIVLGTFQNNNFQSLLDVVDACFSHDCLAFDTAPSYGTEGNLGKAISLSMEKYKKNREEVFVSNKVDAWQMIQGKGDVRKYLCGALKTMNLEYFDMIWIHWPIEEFLDPTWRCLQQLQDEGLIRNIGICNVRVRHLSSMTRQGIFPKNIQIERHPLRICQSEIEYCHSHGIKVYSYSPICRMHHELRDNIMLKRIADKYHKNIGQVILRWHIDTNATPIFMSKNPKRVADNLKILDFRLEIEEIMEISSLNKNYKIFLESWGCPGF